jgi:hypothetical protein
MRAAGESYKLSRQLCFHMPNSEGSVEKRETILIEHNPLIIKICGVVC